MSRLHAVIPAAGRSRRMGEPKLLLPLGGRTVLARLLAALERPGIAGRYVVVRPDDEVLAREAEACGATVVRPAVPPPDMRASVEAALDWIERRWSPAPDDGWLLVPGDHPVLDGAVIDALVAGWRTEDAADCEILVPVCGGRRGHPTLFRWRLAEAVRRLPENAGINRLLHDRAAEVRELAIENEAVLCDLDAPDDYAALRRRMGERNG
ncbi:MAG: nucleotidyltransferase family protein [Planctomycetaceae bacterium]